MTNLQTGSDLSPGKINQLEIEFEEYFCLAVCRIYYNDKQLNGSKITDFQVTGNIDDDDIIVCFYSRTTGMSHGWVAFQTRKGKTF